MSLPLSCPAFADEVVTRLRQHLAQEQARSAASTVAEDPDDALDADLDFSVFETVPQSPLDALAARHRARKAPATRATAAASDATVDTAAKTTPPDRTAPPVYIPAADLALALRLAATFGSAFGLSALLRPGAFTCLGGITAKEAKAIARLLPICLLPPKVRIVDRFSASPPTGRSLLILHPESDEDPISETSRTRFARAITEALAADTTPTLVLLPSTRHLPPDLALHLPLAHELAPLGRALMCAHLGAYYAPLTPDDRAAVAAALPDDRALSGLSDIALALALREPGARAAAERLAALAARQRPSDAPRLEEISGGGVALGAARRLVADLALWRSGQIAWSELGHSMLLHGQPGTGKTWLARAMGESAGIGFVSASFAQWQAAGHLGQMLAAMRASFAEARKIRPAILFIDEIDAVGSRSDPDRHNRNYRHQVINGFLEELDAVARAEGVIVIGACNHPERIDPAVLRAGRFDLKLEVPLPDAGMLYGLLKRHLDFPEPDLRALAAAAVGLSAADLDAAIRLARAAIRAEGRTLCPADLQVRLAILLPQDAGHDRRVALHECGHAIVAAALGRGRVTRLLLTRDGGEASRARIPRGALLDDLDREIAVLLAGRAAERLILGAVSAGAGGGADSDLARATGLALSIDATFGLGVEGPVWHNAPEALLLREPATRDRVRARIEAAEDRATAILALNRGLLEGMAAALLAARELDQAAAEVWLNSVTGAFAGPTRDPETRS